MSHETPNKSVKQLAEFLGLSDDIVYRNVSSSAWPCHRSNPPDKGRILFTAEDVQDILAIMRVRTRAQTEPAERDDTKVAALLAAYQKQLARGA
ncbi:MAG TPA: hypothetical protein VGX23_33745 [Actinocrinis sp.]|nr:hypothetical protein [Actinocrinis sp.]